MQASVEVQPTYSRSVLSAEACGSKFAHSQPTQQAAHLHKSGSKEGMQAGSSMPLTHFVCLTGWQASKATDRGVNFLMKSLISSLLLCWLLQAPARAKVIDASGMYVMPGGIDPHTHLSMPFMGQVACDDFYRCDFGPWWGGQVGERTCVCVSLCGVAAMHVRNMIFMTAEGVALATSFI